MNGVRIRSKFPRISGISEIRISANNRSSFRSRNRFDGRLRLDRFLFSDQTSMARKDAGRRLTFAGRLRFDSRCRISVFTMTFLGRNGERVPLRFGRRRFRPFSHSEVIMKKIRSSVGSLVQRNWPRNRKHLGRPQLP